MLCMRFNNFKEKKTNHLFTFCFYYLQLKSISFHEVGFRVRHAGYTDKLFKMKKNKKTIEKKQLVFNLRLSERKSKREKREREKCRGIKTKPEIRLKH